MLGGGGVRGPERSVRVQVRRGGHGGGGRESRCRVFYAEWVRRVSMKGRGQQ